MSDERPGQSPSWEADTATVGSHDGDAWTPRRRLQATLQHQQPDRVCVDLGAYTASGIAASTLSGVRRALGGEPDYRVKLFEPFLGLGEVDEFVRQALGLDVVGIWTFPTNLGFRNTAWKEWNLMDGTPVLVSTAFDPVETSDGDLLFYPGNDRTVEPSAIMPGGGYYFDPIVRQEPIDEDHLDVAGNLEDFRPLSDSLVMDAASEVERLYADTSYGIFLRFPYTWFGDPGVVPGPGVKRPRGIRDPVEWLMSHVTRQDFLHKVYEHEVDIAIRNLESLAPVLSDRVQVVKVCSTDFGTQQGPMISLETYREIYSPHYRRLNAEIHRRTNWKTFKHCCGSIRELIPDMIDDGFDVLNPVQASAANMDPRDLKREFGRDLVFWGGGVDTQHTLPFGTPDEVYRQARERIDIFNDGGGYVFSAEHNIQARVPVDNVLAMFRAARDSGDSVASGM